MPIGCRMVVGEDGRGGLFRSNSIFHGLSNCIRDDVLVWALPASRGR